MYQGMTLQEMAREVEAKAARKDDLVVDTRRLTLLNGSELHIGGDSIGDSLGEFVVSPIAHRQITERLSIPAKFADRLRDDENEQVKRLLDTNVNTLFREKPERRMIRTYKSWTTTEDSQGNAEAVYPAIARSFNSDSYRRRDDDELLAHVLPILGRIPDVQVVSTGLSERAFYLKAVAPRVQGEVKAGDVVQAGVIVRNSEVGMGSLSIAPFFYRLWCSNGCGTDEIVRHYHVGRHVETDELSRVFSDATLKLDDEAFFAKVADTVEAAVNETRFNDLLVKLRDATATVPMVKPVESIKRLGQKLALTDAEGESILKHLIDGADLSAYGMLNAVTRTSQDAANYDRASELEQMGGKVLAMAGTREWEGIAAA